MGKFKSDPLLKNRAIYGLLDFPVMMMLFGCVKSVIQSWINENGTSGLDGQTMEFAKELDNRVLDFGNLWKGTVGAVSTTPMFFTYSKKVAQDSWNVLTGQRPTQNLIRDMRATEIFHYDSDKDKADREEFYENKRNE